MQIMLLVLIYFTALFLTVNIIMIYVFGATPNTSFTALGFTLLSLAIACHAVIIAINSDEKIIHKQELISIRLK